MHVCLFDIDGTLIQTSGAGRAALQQALLDEFGVTEPIRNEQVLGRTDRGIAAELFTQHGLGDTAENWDRLRECYLSHLPRALSEREGRILPGITRLLETLSGSAEQVVLGLLTGNTRRGAQLKLDHFGLFTHFRLGGFGDRHPLRDDVAREALQIVQEHLNGDVDLQQIWVIGDTPLDVRCARVIGARSIAVATGWHTAEQLDAERPDVVLENLDDTVRVLQHWGL